MDAPDYESEYNNRARVPEHPEILQRWKTDAAAFRSKRQDATLETCYGPSERNLYDFFPRTAGPARGQTALFIHGGYWQALDRTSFSHMANGLNARGFDVAVANYTLCPEVSVDGIISEMRELAKHLYGRFGRPLLVCGHSAGGHLSAALMATDWAGHGLPKDLVTACMPISGLFDLEPLVATSVNNALNMTPESAREASPAFWPAPAEGRFCAVVGEDESSEYHRQSKLLCDTWTGAGLVGSLSIAEGANHFTVIDPLSDSSSSMIETLVGLAGDTDVD
jgi:arylformamidase